MRALSKVFQARSGVTWAIFKNTLLTESFHSKQSLPFLHLSTSTSSLDLSGIFPPITTPFVHSSLDDGAHCKANEEDVHWGNLSDNLSKWMKLPFQGFVVQGSNGEVAYLSETERVSIVSAVKAHIPADSGKIVIAGAGCESTRATIAMCQEMAAAGADALLVVTPAYYKGGMSNAALINHFTKVADASPKPVILYSVPGNTGIDLSPEVALAMAPHPNVIGMKDSGGNVAKTAFIVAKTRNVQGGFQFLAGSASFLLPSYHVGAVGGICALANVLGEQVCELDALFRSGHYEAAVTLQGRLIEPNDAVTKHFGVAGLKRALDWFGFAGGLPRSPLLPLDKRQEHELRRAFTTNGFYPQGR